MKRFERTQNMAIFNLAHEEMKRDERDLQIILTFLKNWTPNMWHSDQPISNIATGKITTEAMSKNILSLKERGQQATTEFIGRFSEIY